MAKLTLEFFRDISSYRCLHAFGRAVHDWTPAEWACALAGEVGELCNEIKKNFRGDPRPEEVSRRAIENEIADVFAYLVLLATRFDIDLESVVIRKFNEVSIRRGRPDIVIEYPERSLLIGEHVTEVYTFEPRL